MFHYFIANIDATVCYKILCFNEALKYGLICVQQPTLSLEIDNLQATKQKLERRITELKDEVQREKSLRSSLEQSQQTLINRIQEIEENIEKERQQVNIGHL